MSGGGMESGVSDGATRPQPRANSGG
eukprot:COSAG02_NODE_27943_length_599_cov_1.534000_1_plen_25_part_01